MKRYLCVQCEEHFESDEDKPRCPTCMRVTGVHPEDEQDEQPQGEAAGAERAQSAGRVTPLGATLGVLALVGMGVALFALREQPTDGAGGTDAPVVAGLPAELADDPMARLLQADDAIAAFADDVAGDKPEGLPRAEAIVAALRARADAGAFVRWSMAEPRSEPAPMTATETWAAMQKDGAKLQLYPLEVAAVALAAMRSAGVEAKLVEVFAFEGERTPPDPSGRLGYYAVLVGAGENAKLLDPYGGRSEAVAPGDRMALSDAQAVGAAVGLRAVHGAQPGGHVGRALRDASSALSLVPKSPTVRTAHAFTLLVSGAAMDGLRELQAALQQRDDAPRNVNAGFGLMAGGQFSEAAKHISRAVELRPDYALGHLNLARLLLAQGERAQARAELEKAEALEPDMPLLALAWSGYHLAGGELQEALTRAEQAVDDRPASAEARLTLARILREVGRYDDMRKHARELLEMVSEDQKARTRQLIEMTLGPTALEEPAAEDATPSVDAGTAAPSDGALDITKGSKLLGDGPSGGPSLGGGDLKLKLDL